MGINEKRNVKKVSKTVAPFFEPFAVVILLIIFSIPIAAVINLSPETRNQDTNVLGVTSENKQAPIIDDSTDITSEQARLYEGIKLTAIGGTHRYITSEKIQEMDTQTYKYSAMLLKHDSSRYSKPILDIENLSDTPRTLQFSGTTETTGNTKLIVRVNNIDYVLQESDGTIFTHNILLEANQMTTAFLAFQSDTDVQYNESVTIAIIEQIAE